MLSITLSIFFIVIIALVFTLLAKKIKIPVVVTLIISGLIIGVSSLKNYLIGVDNMPYVMSLGDLGLVSLMFLAGMESSWRVIYKERKDSIIIALFAAIIPFFVGFFASLMLGFSYLVAGVVGICLSVTAEATKARVLLEINKLKSRVGAAMMGAGILDDLMALVSFFLFLYYFNGINIREVFLISLAIISFFIGVLVKKGFGRENVVVSSLERILLYGIVPFFFVSIGLRFDYSALFVNPFLVFVILGCAILGKIVGTFCAKPFVDFSWKQLHLIGWAMNSRGAVELALALIAFRVGFISSELYSSLVVIALVTTLIFPFVIICMVRKDKRLMN